MIATNKSASRIRGTALVPRLPSAPRRGRSNEAKQVEDYIRSLGGKPMTQATKRRLAKAGCLAFPDE